LIISKNSGQKFKKAAVYSLILLGLIPLSIIIISLVSPNDFSLSTGIIISLSALLIFLLAGLFILVLRFFKSLPDPMQVLLDAIPVAIALFNVKKEIIYRNRVMDDFLLMHDLMDFGSGFLESIVGSGMLDGDTLAPEVEDIFDPGLPAPKPFITDIALLGHDGGSNFTVNLQRVQANVESVFAILILNDVTMLTRAKIDAEAASRTKSDFLSRMSHEIRTPMNAVLGMTQIARTSDDINKIRDCLEQADSFSHHLLGIINDILDYSKMESGKMLLDINEFSLVKNLDYVISLMLPRARERKIDLKLSLENINNDTISTDSLRLNQVLINLLANAIKFSHEESEVLLKVRELGNDGGFSTYRFDIIDYGIGINEYQASKLFRPFEQADSYISRNYGGTGLGLAISRTLVEMMGGIIDLESTEGEGSTFSFTIHCASRSAMRHEDEETEEQRIKKAPDAAAYDFSGKNCLVVDDIEINREIICELLSVTGMSLEIAENGMEAIDLFRKKGAAYYDIILMDMQMPVMDGCSATIEIRRLEKETIKDGVYPVPIVAMTANVMYEDVKKAMDSGMNAHLGKPIELGITLKTIQEQLSKAPGEILP